MAPSEVTSNHVVSVPQVNSIHRVVDLPVVKSALGVANDWYGWAKGCNSLVGSSLEKAEQTVWFVADSAKPVIQKLEKPITYADSIVCQGLDKLEEKVPAIKKSPDELKNDGWGKLETIKGYGTAQVDSVKAYVASLGAHVMDLAQVASGVVAAVEAGYKRIQELSGRSQ